MMIKTPRRFLIVVLLLGWVFDFLFWEKSIGVNFAIFTTLSLLGGIYILFVNGMRPAPQSLLLLIPFLFFAVVTFMRREPLTAGLAYTFVLFSMGVFATTYAGGKWLQYRLFDYFYQFFDLLISISVRPLQYLAQLRQNWKERAPEEQRKFPVWPVLRGLLIALPVVACFGSLFASADLVFNQRIVDFFEDYSFRDTVEDVFRVFLILFWAYILMGVFLHTAAKSTDEKLLGEDKLILKPFLGFTEAAIVLSSVVVLFSAFVSIQFQYFFGKTANIGVGEFTYSEYARRGFTELVLVIFFSLLLVLGLNIITRRGNGLQKRIYSGLSVLLLLLVIPILVSGFQRLLLGIEWHGYSRLRLYPRIFMIWVAILLAAVIVLEIFRRERYFALAALLASIGFAASLSFFDIDASIAGHNIYRAATGRHFNVTYLASLSTDAIPRIAYKFKNSDLPTTTREGVGAALLCYMHSNAFADEFKGVGDLVDESEAEAETPGDEADQSETVTEEAVEKLDWQGFTVSRGQALEALDEIEPLLGDYHINTERNPMRVVAPSEAIYECPWGGGD
ncbi:MAG: DUF4173 domain-containing protein [Anaerolineales bacterium]|nr:DUF4173 domain-containing protein [Anaerolineales bacterium]